MQFLYMAALVFSSLGMVVLDRKYQLAFLHDWRRTSLVLLIGLAVFIIWDLAGIGLGIFFSGHSDYMSGWYLLPELPVEEILFLLFLCYFTLIVYRLGERRWPRT